MRRTGKKARSAARSFANRRKKKTSREKKKSERRSQTERLGSLAIGGFEIKLNLKTAKKKQYVCTYVYIYIYFKIKKKKFFSNFFKFFFFFFGAKQTNDPANKIKTDR